jgi:hypothetical protein
LRTSREKQAFIGYVALHNPFSGMAGALLAGQVIDPRAKA